MKKIILATFLFSFSALLSAAESFLPQTFSADFEQTQISALSGKEKKSQGHLDYKFPGHIRFEVNKPDVIIFVSNPRKTWYYTAPFVAGEPGEVTVKPTGKLALSKFFDALKQGLKSNDLYSVKENDKDKDKDKDFNTELIFSKKSQEELGIVSATLIFTKKKEFSALSTIELLKNDKAKAKVKLVFSNMKINNELAKERFEFQAPPNTRSSQ